MGTPSTRLGMGPTEPQAKYPSGCLGFPNRLRLHAGSSLPLS